MNLLLTGYCPGYVKVTSHIYMLAQACRGRSAGTIEVSSVETLPKEGLEPSWSCPRRILSPLRLPVPPLRRMINSDMRAGGCRPFGTRHSGWGISSISMYLPLARATILPISFSISARFSITRLFFFTYQPRMYRFSLMNAGWR